VFACGCQEIPDPPRRGGRQDDMYERQLKANTLANMHGTRPHVETVVGGGDVIGKRVALQRVGGDRREVVGIGSDYDVGGGGIVRSPAKERSRGYDVIEGGGTPMRDREREMERERERERDDAYNRRGGVGIQAPAPLRRIEGKAGRNEGKADDYQGSSVILEGGGSPLRATGAERPGVSPHEW
jgi:hypothetical protein